MDNKGSNSNVIDAVVSGASTGMSMIVGIASSLIAVLGLVALINLVLGFIRLDLETIFSYVFAPFGLLMGLDAENILQEGMLLGQKLALNEFVAFGNLGTFIEELDPRFAMIASISIAGFANVSSMGICVGGIGVLCPEKRGTLSRLVLKAMLGGMLVSILSAMICGTVALF